MNFSATPLIQYLRPVGAGPSSKTCPKCALQLLQLTSVLLIPCERSIFDVTASFDKGLMKLGQPEPLSNFSLEENNSLEQQIHGNVPAPLGNPGCENGGSVSPSWVSRTPFEITFYFPRATL